jgi:hypothetical protein
LKNFLEAFETPRWPYGYGTGTASLGSQYVARLLHAPSTGVAVENGYGQLVVEMGVLGMILWIVLGAALAGSAWKLVKSLRGSPWFPLAFVIFWFVFLLFFPMGYNSLAFYQDFLVNSYLWFLIGVLYRLPKLALSAQFASQTASPAAANLFDEPMERHSRLLTRELSAQFEGTRSGAGAVVARARLQYTFMPRWKPA